MKEIKAVWGFEHIPDGTQYWLASEIPTGIGGAFSQTAFVTSFKNARWVGGTAALSYLCFNINNLNMNWTKRLIWGCRLYTSNPAATRLWSFYNAAGNATAITGGEVLASTIGVTANQESYIEMELDIIGQKQNFYIDGNPKAAYSRALTTAQSATLLTTYFNVLIGATGTAATWYAKDFVFSHCSGADDISILGPVDLTMWNPTAITAGPSYAGPASMSQLQAISSPIVDKVNSLLIPRLESAAGAAAGGVVLRMGVDPARVSGNILGVSVFSSAQDVAASPHTLNAKLTQNSVDAVLAGVLQKATYQYGASHSVSRTAPDGSSWTVAKINSTDLTLSIA